MILNTWKMENVKIIKKGDELVEGVFPADCPQCGFRNRYHATIVKPTTGHAQVTCKPCGTVFEFDYCIT